MMFNFFRSEVGNTHTDRERKTKRARKRATIPKKPGCGKQFYIRNCRTFKSKEKKERIIFKQIS